MFQKFIKYILQLKISTEKFPEFGFHHLGMGSPRGVTEWKRAERLTIVFFHTLPSKKKYMRELVFSYS